MTPRNEPEKRKADESDSKTNPVTIARKPRPRRDTRDNFPKPAQPKAKAKKPKR